MGCFGKKKPIQEGDFSFIKDKRMRLSMQHDYKYCYNDIEINDSVEGFFEEGKRSSFNIDPQKTNVWDTPPGYEWRRISMASYPLHTEETYNRNMKMLLYISKNGWTEFVK